MQHRLVVTDIFGQPIGPIFKGQAVGFLAVEEEAYRLSRNISNKVPICAV